jgi:hypothetical protein
VLLVIYPHLLCPHIWATEILDNSIFAGQKRDQASKTPDSLLLLRLVGITKVLVIPISLHCLI